MKKLRNTTLFQYCLSYISIALLSCALIGLSVFILSVNELSRTAGSSEEQKLALAAADLDRQEQVFEDIRDAIASAIVYRPSYQQLTIHHELELLQDFKQYHTYSVLCDSYFLYYRMSGSFFTETAKYPLERYISTIMSFAGSPEEVRSVMNSLNSLTLADQGMLIDTGREHILLCYPIRLGSAMPEPSAVLGFFIDRNTLLSRLTTASGHLGSSVSVCYRGALIAGTALPDDFSLSDDSESFSTSDLIAIQSASGSFILAEAIPVGGWYRGLNTFSRIITILLLAVMFIIITASIWMARKNHAPIHRLASQAQELLTAGSEANDINEINQIEHAIVQTLQQSSLNQKRLEEQTNELRLQSAQIRQQALMLLLTGTVSDSLLRQLDLLHIRFDGPYYCAYTIDFEKAFSSDILSSIELLSDDEQHFYCLRIDERQAVILASLAFKSLAEEAIDIISDVITDSSNGFTLKTGPVVDLIDKLPASYYAAQLSPAESVRDIKADDEAATTARNAWYPRHHLTLLLDSIRTCDSSAALSHLTALLDTVQNDFPSMLLQRSVIADILCEIVHVSYELGIPLSSEETGPILIYQNSKTVRDELTTLVSDLIDRLTQRRVQYDSDTAQQIRAYIDAHALDANISLQQVADQFNLPAKQINKYIRQITGQTYKDYEISLRIQKAKSLLESSSLTLIQISQQIGYNDVSSFLKAFKNSEGITPAAYRKALK